MKRKIMKTTIAISIIAASLLTFTQAIELPSGVEQACAGKAAQMKNIRMSDIRTGRTVRWADASGAVVLKLPDKKEGVCWFSRKGKIEKIIFGKSAGQGQEQACAAEAAGSKNVRMSEVRAPWSTLGPKGKAWVLLTLNGKKMDCLVSASNEVLVVESYR